MNEGILIVGAGYAGSVMARELAEANPGLKATDDCDLILHHGLTPVQDVAGDANNIKITYLSDIYLADRFLQLRTHPGNMVAPAAGLNGKVLRNADSVAQATQVTMLSDATGEATDVRH